MLYPSVPNLYYGGVQCITCKTMTETHTAETLTEGEEVELTMEFDSGEKTGALLVTEVRGRTKALVEDDNGTELELNFSGQHVTGDDFICTLMRNGQEMATVTAMEGY